MGTHLPQTFDMQMILKYTNHEPYEIPVVSYISWKYY